MLCSATEHTELREVLLTDRLYGKVKVKLTQQPAMKANSTGTALLLFNLGFRWEWGVNVTPRPLYPRE